MRFLRDISIRQKLTQIIMLTSGAALLLACVAFILYELVSFRYAMTRELLSMADIIGANSTAALEFNDPSAGEETLAALRADPRIVSASIYTKEKKIFATYQRGELEGHFIPPEPRKEGTYLESGYLLLFRPIILDNERIGTIYIQSNLRDVYARLKRYITIAAAVLAGSFLLAFLLSSTLQRVISGPILHLAETASRVSTQKDYSLRAVKQSQDELGTLIDRFNEMLADIQSRDEALHKAHSELERRAQELQKELTERKRAEEQISASLKEKEALLKEIHHRVKNNLQVISSLLNLQSGYIKDGRAFEMFKESQNRVRSMALIHEKLYQSKDLARIDFAGYIRGLATYLYQSYGVNAATITLKINVDDISLGIDTAIPCGLIINELISNSLKHAFPGGREGEVRIDLHPNADTTFTLMVRDNGVGFPEDVDFRNTESLGLQLVNTLTDQLGGTIELKRNGGTEFTITFAV